MSAEMTDNLEALPARVDRIEQKLDSLAGSVDRRFERVDRRFDSLTAEMNRRFDDVTDALVEQRQYTEFGVDRLRREMLERFEGVDRRFDGVDQRFDGVDQRLEGVDQRLETIEQRLNHVITLLQVKPRRRTKR